MLSPDRIFDGAAPNSQADTSRRLLWLALAAVVVAAAAILGALGFQYIGHYQPCHLCLMQRPPYYYGVPVAAVTLLAVLFHAPNKLVAGLFAVFGVLMFYGGVIAVYHSGVEWGFWPGPASCTPSTSVNSAADMLAQLSEHAPNCTEAALRIWGVSLADGNALVSALLFVLAAIGMRTAWES